jgi:hypothetical protein
MWPGNSLTDRPRLALARATTKHVIEVLVCLPRLLKHVGEEALGVDLVVAPRDRDSTLDAALRIVQHPDLVVTTLSRQLEAVAPENGAELTQARRHRDSRFS